MKRLRLHLLCLLSMAMTVGLHALGHTDEQQLWKRVASGTPRERVAALHALSQRSDADTAVLKPLGKQLLSDPEPLLREYAGTVDLTRFGAASRPVGARGPQPQEHYLQRHLATAMASGELDVHTWLYFVFYRRKVGGIQLGSRRRLDQQELTWTLGALAGEAPPSRAALEHLSQRLQGAGRVPPPHR